MNLIPRRLFATAILVLLFSGMLTSVSSVALAQGKEEAPGQVKKEARAEEEAAAAEEEADEADEEDSDESISASADSDSTDSSRDDSADAGVKGVSTDDDDVPDGCNPQKPGKCHPYEPDPEPVKTVKATKGPTECPDYDQRDAGAYDHDNCDGTIGLHGNGGNGKCAGCTGKADDKAPGGQYPGDHNNGYECDHNSGVGKGNPAHSKCAVESPSRPSRPSRRDSNPSRPDFNRPRSVPDVNQPPVVLPAAPIPAPPVTVLGKPPVAAPAPPPAPPAELPGVLPVTGSKDVSIFMFIGVLLIGAGSLFVSVDAAVARAKRSF